MKRQFLALLAFLGMHEFLRNTPQYEYEAPIRTTRHSGGIVSRGRKPEYKLTEASKLRKEKLWMRQYNLHLQGLHEFQGKLYWMTHQLSIEHAND